MSELLPWQTLALQLRKASYLAMFSARGGGKTHMMSVAIIAHCQELGAKARPLALRETFVSTAEWGDTLYSMALQAFGPKVTRNRSIGEIYLPNGAVITLAFVATDDGVRKILGRNFTALYADEVGNYPPQAFTFLQRARSSVRPPPPFKEEVMLAGNFGGKSHSRIQREYWSKAPAWAPFKNQFGEVWTNVPSSYRDNRHINTAQYARALRVATAGNPALFEAWDSGVPATGSGVLFANYSPSVHLVEPPTAPPQGKYLAGVDWGTASPSVATLLVKLSSPWKFGERMLLPGDVVAIDSVDTVADELREDLSTGTGLPPTEFGAEIEQMARRWRVHQLDCVVDDARGLENDTVVDLLNKNEGISATRVHKRTRSAGWNMIRQGFQRATDRERQGYFVCSNLDALARTIPECPRHPTRLEESDDKFTEDHHLDSYRYGIEALEDAVPGSGRVIGGY
jgi:hypothetical protein